ERERELQAHRLDLVGGPFLEVEVGVAHTGATDLDHDLARARVGLGDVTEVEILVRADELVRAHTGSLRGCRDRTQRNNWSDRARFPSPPGPSTPRRPGRRAGGDSVPNAPSGHVAL